jgi:membrane-associated protease RseP (regulator of RpoE activity)
MKLSVALCVTLAILPGLNTAEAQQNAPAGQPGNFGGQGDAQIRSQLYSWTVPTLNFQPGQPFNGWTVSGDAFALFNPVDRTAGLVLSPADDALRVQLGLPKDQGLVVTSLVANTPAAQAGIQQNDVLLKLGETPLGKAEDLEETLKATASKPTPLTVLREGKSLVIQVQPRLRVTLGPVQPEPPAFWIGVSISPIEPALRSQLKLPANQGLLAIDVVKDSPAAAAQVKVHDILLSLDGKGLESQEKLVEIVQSTGQKSVLLEVIREGKKQTIGVTPQRRKPAPTENPGINQQLSYVFSQVGPQGTIMYPNGGWIANYNVEGAVDLKPEKLLAGSEKRLDDLDAEIKQLRKAIEELNKTLKDKK